MAEGRLTGKQRLAFFLSAGWIILVMILSSIGGVFNSAAFLAIGLLPVAFVWGLAWVIRGFRRKD